ncbi:MAG: YbhN family protein [Rubinisphaera brasiliensis]|uniref:lysylphosphatidylglycerol synthase transmembrane domain-containing protein n=1 Tax=Rubinisphaera brasiliensis TaxID=119 RepID=UPI00391B1F58
MTSESGSLSVTRSLWKPVLKWTLFLVVLIFVVRYGYRQMQQVDFSELTFSPGWLALAIGVYFLGWVPAATVWYWLLHLAGQPVRFYPALRAHFCGHLGKYVPGKAVALVIRAGMVKPFGVSAALAGLLATVETLLTMATGLLIFTTLLPLVARLAVEDSLAEKLPWLERFGQLSFQTQISISAGLLIAAVLAAPLASKALTWLVGKLAKKSGLSTAVETTGETVAGPMKEEAGSETRLPAARMTGVRLTGSRLIVSGLIVAFGWIVNGACLGAILQSLGGQPASGLDLLLWIAAVSGATSIGFLVLFAPGGLGVREALLVTILQISPQIDAGTATIAAVLLRIVSFSSEVIFAALLAAWKPRGAETTLSPDSSAAPDADGSTSSPQAIPSSAPPPAFDSAD